MSLTTAQFHNELDRIQNAIEDIFDASALDIDIEQSGGVLTVRFSNNSQLIISRQEPLKQLWVAARSGGFHCDSIDGNWFCRASQETLAQLLTRITLEQSGESLDFSKL